MARGGMYDQIGGGFHRYSTDDRWLVPHFEKMLYDNAQLAIVYYEAFQVIGNNLYKQIGNQTLDYVFRDMTDASGGFYSSQDADSDGVEGKYYVWRPEEMAEALEANASQLVQEYYGVTKQEIFEKTGSILHVPDSEDDFLNRNNLLKSDWDSMLSDAKDKLLERRNLRKVPGKDDKIIAAWNGMMISAFCKGYQVTGSQRYLDAARRCGDFIYSSMRDSSGELLRSYRQGQAKIPGFIDDYAFFIRGLIDLYESTFDCRWLNRADLLTGKMIELFWDDHDPGFFFHNGKDSTVLNRSKVLHDMALPSGNAIAIQALERLAALLDKKKYKDIVHRALLSVSSKFLQSPRGYEETVVAVDFMLHPPLEIAIVGSQQSKQTANFLRTAYRRYIPNRIIAFLERDSPDRKSVESKIPLLEGKSDSNKTPTAFICRNYICRMPIADVEEFARQLADYSESN